MKLSEQDASNEETRTFPIQRDYHWPGDQLRQIPWTVLAPHETQARWNHDQSLETLARRGGLSACEAVAVLEDRPWHRMGPADADYRLRKLVEAAQSPAAGEAGTLASDSLVSDAEVLISVNK